MVRYAREGPGNASVSDLEVTEEDAGGPHRLPRHLKGGPGP